MASKPLVSGYPAGVIKLPEPRQESKTSVESALCRRRSVREFGKAGLTLAEISQLLWAAQGITDPEGRRAAPSAGALYPLEVLLVAGGQDELPAGVYRYRPQGHDLIPMVQGDQRAKLAAAALEQDWLNDAPATIAIAAVYERTARKYKQGAERYVLMEVGHAAQNVHLQAVALDLGTVVVGAFDDADVKRVLALAVNEEPLCLMPVGKPRS
ncbi:MAG TPA: SagB/ThcOx family dehydrogenase [Dongiaceae bacterium]|nr:SagB/ThcOx family dehydrogenase [Dongiaceae bacterium]